MNAPRLLLIEDDLALAASFHKVLRSEGYEVTHAARGDEGLELATKNIFDLVITDLRLPGTSGLELVSQIHAANPKLPVLLMTAYGTSETAIEATRFGACEYLVKPFQVEELLDLVASAIQKSRLTSDAIEMGQSSGSGSAIVGSSRVMQKLYKEIGRIAGTQVPVLIRGESGTGKELVARAIYQHSTRAMHPFVAMNCAAVPEALLESELFGHERGAFTGAVSRRIGRFEQAQAGTLFLDEIGDLPLTVQSKLLRVLQEKCITRLGGETPISVDVRVLAATHRDLEAAVRNEEFRQDLYFRLNVVNVRVPPLREHSDDIPELVRYFMQNHAADLGIEAPAIQPEALAFLGSQEWPGNVRELENVVRQALVLARPFGVALEHVQSALARTALNLEVSNQTHAAYVSELLQRAQSGEVTDAYDRLIADLEPELFAQALKLAHGNQAQVARWLGIGRFRLREKLLALGLHPGGQKESS